MAGKWVEAWDDSQQKWIKLYIEEPLSGYSGTAYVISQPKASPLILGPDGKALKPTSINDKRVGFKIGI